MAAALVVGALVSGFANVVLDRLISSEFVNLVVGKKLNKKLINRLRTAILAAKALAADAEQKQFGDELVREWLDSLRDALYTADDLLDHVFTKAQIRSKVRPRLPSCLHLSDRKMVTKIEDVIERIEDLERRKDILGLRVLQTGSSSSWRPSPSTSLEKGTVYGRDADKQALMKMLNDNNDHKLSVISIVGLGGVGKTTLAQWLYNNEDLMKGFDPKAWVCVSENFDVVETTKNVIKEINSGVCSLDSFNLLQQDLKGKLSQKKFFIVLDDVWSEDADKWNSFITPFQHGRNGSTLLLTTRNKNVGPRVQNYYSYPLEGLSNDHCWSIFAANASFPESNGCSELEEIGRMIVKRCDGLPLAAETLGRLLHSEHHVEEWKKILSSDIWELSITDSKIVPALLISYYHLPAHLKRCFVYSSLYPKAHTFNKKELILLWMAEDLLPPPKKGETLEAVGYECFDDLASRLFFKQVQENDEKHFVMHDLMHDLATFLAGKFYCRLSEGENEEMRSLTRHLSCDHPISEKTYSASKIESLRTFLNTDHGPLWIEKESSRILSKNKYLRVLSSEKLSEFPGSIVKLIHLRYLDLSWSNFEVLPQSLCNLCNLQTLKLRQCYSLTTLPSSLGELIHLHYLDVSRSAIKTLPESLGKLSYLQTLKLSWCSELTMIPSSLGELIHLHYLNLSGSGIKTLPESLCKLSYLQTLKLGSCSKLTMLPNGMYNLVNLRHLDITGTPLKEMPKGIGKLKQLHILSNYIVGKQKEYGIQELGGLLNLHGSFLIQKLENVVDINQARNARIMDKKHIDKLWLEWSSGNDMVSNIQIEGDVLNNLRPHTGLKELIIDGYKGKIFPDWLGQHSYNNMTSVSLYSCKNCCKLPSLGQLPSLKSLTIYGFSELKCIGDEFYKNEDDHTLHIVPFPSLETLKFMQMPFWELWYSPSSEAFPQLNNLEIEECPKLKGDIVNQIFMRIISSSSDVSKVRTLFMHAENFTGMSVDGDSLSLKGCEWLVESTFMATSIHHLTSLQDIEINGFLCAAISLPKSLQKLVIWNCTELEFPEQQQHKYDLVELEIYASCDSLASLSLDAFPNLKTLSISDCSNLESISMSEPPHTALQSLTITRCHKLEALPRKMDTLVPNLQSLHIQDYGRICRFPEGGLPPNLQKLCVNGSDVLLRGLSSMGKLEALTHLEIYACDYESRINSFPEVDTLPHLPSLTTQQISSFENLETLECNELLHLTSLQQLHIQYCRNLQYLEGEKLPSSLLLLEIKDCPLLEEGCENKHQHIWPKIQHIPTIRLNYEDFSK